MIVFQGKLKLAGYTYVILVVTLLSLAGYTSVVLASDV